MNTFERLSQIMCENWIHSCDRARDWAYYKFQKHCLSGMMNKTSSYFKCEILVEAFYYTNLKIHASEFFIQISRKKFSPVSFLR